MAKRVISAILRFKDENFSSGLRRANAQANDFGRYVNMTQNKVENFSRSAVRAFKAVGAGATALGTAGIAALGAGVAKSIVETDSAFSRLEARTGATGAKLKSLENVAKDVFKAGFGEDISQVADDVSTLGAMFSNLKNDQLTEVAKGASTIAKTWDAEAKQVGKTVQSMTSNFKGLSETKALDLMTHAFQKTGDYSDDLLDTFNEYSVHFSKLGLSAEEFTGILIKGAEKGAWNMDKVGDAVKEFGIRAIDGSKGTTEGFKAIGLNADEMANKFIAGGETANNAFAATIAGLAAMKNPVEQNAAGVALFGTMWEDLREDVVLSMSDSLSAVQGFEGATGRAADALHNNFQSKLIQSWRDLQLGIADVINGAGAQEFLDGIAQKADELVPKIQSIVEKAFEFGNTIRDNWGPIKETVIGITVALATFKAGMVTMTIVSTVTKFMTGFTAAVKAGTVAQWAFNIAANANPFGLIVAGIAAAVAIGVLLYRNWDTVKEKAGQLWSKIKENPFAAIVAGPFGLIIGAAVTLYKNFDKIKSSFDRFKSAISNFKLPKWVSSVGSTISGAVSKVKGLASFDVGTNRVGSDQVANIHKDEMIIPARQAARVRAAGGTIDNIDKLIAGNQSGTPNVNVTSTSTSGEGKGNLIQFGDIIVQGMNKTTAEIANEIVYLIKLQLANM